MLYSQVMIVSGERNSLRLI